MPLSIMYGNNIRSTISLSYSHARRKSQGKIHCNELRFSHQLSLKQSINIFGLTRLGQNTCVHKVVDNFSTSDCVWTSSDTAHASHTCYDMQTRRPTVNHSQSLCIAATLLEDIKFVSSKDDEYAHPMYPTPSQPFSKTPILTQKLHFEAARSNGMRNMTMVGVSLMLRHDVLASPGSLLEEPAAGVGGRTGTGC